MDVLVYGGGGPIAAPVVAALALAKRGGKNVTPYVLAREGATFNQLWDHGLTVQYRAEATSRKDPLPDDAANVRIEPKEYNLISGTYLSSPEKPMHFIILGLKATEVTFGRLDELEAAGWLGPETKIVTLQNGVPIWLPMTKEARAKGIVSVETVDPGGRIVNKYGSRLVGGFTAAAARQIPGTPASSEVTGDYPFFFNMPDSAAVDQAAQVRKLVRVLKEGGLNVQMPEDILKQAFLKLFGNTPLNAISALTNATLAKIGNTPELRAFALQTMTEVQAVAVALGIEGADTLDLERRLDAAAKLTHRPSMWGDINGGKVPEIDALIGAVVELGGRLKVATPTVHALFDEMEALAIRTLSDAYSPSPHRPGARLVTANERDIRIRLQHLPVLGL